jgi:hypothetical protein
VSAAPFARSYAERQSPTVGGHSHYLLCEKPRPVRRALTKLGPSDMEASEMIELFRKGRQN